MVSWPTLTLVINSTPESLSKLTRRSTTSLPSFIFGIPYINNPPIRSSRSNTVTQWPILLSSSAAAKPAGPEPTMAIFLPVRYSTMCGCIQPSSKPRSIIVCSIFLMVTAGLLIPSTQEPSQGAGQTLPVNSGKLLVLCRRINASCHLSL